MFNFNFLSMRKRRKKINIIFCLLFLFSLNVYSQSRIITGTVKDDLGLEMPGVTVQLKGTSDIGTITDFNGVFSLDIGSVRKPVLKFSFVGFKTQEVDVSNLNVVDLEMSQDVAKLDEVVVIGYGTQKRISITGAVNSIKPDELTLSSSSSIATALTGRLPGTVIVQNSGLAGSKASNISIRGAGSPLILVDGIERSFEDLDMDEVESISVLKDASATAVYGIRGGNGVIIVTTKRGHEGKFKVNLKTEFGLSKRGKFPEMLDSYNYALLQNEGNRNDNFIALDDETYTGDLYSKDEIELYRTGIDPIMHPSHNWADDLMNDFGHRERYNLSLSGGNKFFKSFTTIGYMNERDVYKSYDVGYNDKSTYSRYNIRTNLDLNLTSSTVLSFDLGGQFSNRHRPNTDFAGLTKDMLITPPNRGTLYDGKLISTTTEIGDFPFKNVYDVGYKDEFSNKLQFALKLNQKLDFITKGLKFGMSVSYDHGFSNTYTATHSVPIYIPGFTDKETGTVYTSGLEVDSSTGLVKNPVTSTWVPLSEVELLRNGTESKLNGSRGTGTSAKNFNLRANLNYSRTFGKHDIGAMAVFTINSKSFHSSSDSYVPLRYMELAARLSYNYDSKYFVEVNAGYNGSETFASKNRFGFFPAVSLGYVLTNENFFPKNNVLTFLKLRGSFGTTGIDKGINRFMYYDEYNISYSGGYLFGSTPGGLGEAIQTAAGNMDVMWATNYQKNIALETKWFDDKLRFDADFFRNDRKGIMMEPNSVPSIVASQLPAGNLKDLRYEGYEFQLGWKDNIGSVSYNLFANYNYANAINIFIDEVKPEYDWQIKTGKNPNQMFGLECIGFYSQEDIDFLNNNGGKGTKDIPSSNFATKLHPGDLKYKDLNEDGIIDDNDMKYFENTTTPKRTFGFGGGLRWKKFGVNVFFQGASDVSYLISGQMRVAFQSGGCNGAEYITKRWTQERFDAGEDILFPRMSATGAATDHNYQSSNFWLKDASYIRLKNLELSYKVKTKKLQRLGVEALNITLSGTNLFTWSKLDIVDPETKSGDNIPVPPNKVYTLGLNFSF